MCNYSRKIALDWGRDAEYLSRFSLVIFVPCRCLDNKSFEKWVVSFNNRERDTGVG